jgi:uncharacterized protein (TIGR03118 family)
MEVCFPNLKFMEGTMFSLKNFPVARLVSKRALFLVAIALLSLPATAQFGQLYRQTNLTSDLTNISSNNDANLVNPWGLVASATGPWWVSDNGTGLATIYNASGTPQALVVSVPQWDGTPGGNPTGIVFNFTTDFKIGGSATHFLFATEDGTIQGWSSGTSTAIALNNFPNAVYKGLAMASAGGANYLYAANFRGGTVDVFDMNFAPHTFGATAFVDGTIPSGFAPFNVANINGNIVVTYAKQDSAKHDDVEGQGNGYVRVFDSQGNILMQLAHVPQLDSPWAVVLAPATGFGALSGRLLIGNFGSGAIVAYDLNHNGTFNGMLADTSGLPIRIIGLWSLAFGNGGSAGPTTTLYFTAGGYAEAHGLFGTVEAVTH